MNNVCKDFMKLCQQEGLEAESVAKLTFTYLLHNIYSLGSFVSPRQIG